MTAGITRFDKTVFAGKPAWWGFHEVVDHLMSSEEAQRLALNWEPQLVNLYKKPALTGVAGFFSSDPDELEDWKGVVRSDDNYLLGVVGKGFSPILKVTHRDSRLVVWRQGDLHSGEPG